MLIWLLSAPGRDLVQVALVQHMAGVVTGLLVYVAVVRAGAWRWWATGAAALVLLDAYAVALEQYIMADTSSHSTSSGVRQPLVWPALKEPGRPPGVVRTAIAGLLLAAAVLQRLEGLFVVPVLVIYLLWGPRGRGLLASFLVCLAVPLLMYSALEQADFGTFGLSQWTGWTAYARVAGFATCRGAGIAADARSLCESQKQRAGHPDASVWYLFDAASPAIRAFGPISRGVAEQRRSNSVLERFALRIALHQPWALLSAITGDFLRFFAPGTAAFDDATGATALPVTAAAEYSDPYAQQQYVPRARATVHAPSRLLRAYRTVVHLPRPLLALLAIASIAAVALRAPAGREVLLLAGSGLVLLGGTAATAGFAQRYTLSAVPTLAIGGTIALQHLGIWRSRRGVRPGRDGSATVNPRSVPTHAEAPRG